MTLSALANSSQLIIRNLPSFESEHLLLMGMPADDLAQQLVDKACGRITALTRDYGVFRRLESGLSLGERFSLSFAPALEQRPEGVDGILIFLQKSKPLMDFWLQMAAPLLAEGGRLWLVGGNDEGIKSWKKRLKNTFAQVQSIDSARHCVLIEASTPLHPETDFNWADKLQKFTVHPRGETVDVFSLPGVFSHGRLDRGTQVLLDTVDELPEGRVLDFGCGTGVISAFVASLPGERSLTLVDCDALALSSSRKTMEQCCASDFSVVPSDGLSEVRGEFDLILSNPPFHQGVKTHYEVTEQFLAQSRALLRKGGELRIVANSFLRYPPIIRKAFGHCETIVVRDGFSVYRAIV